MKAQGIGLLCGGQTTKIHALVDVLVCPDILLLTSGNASDVRTVPEVLTDAPGCIHCQIADESYGRRLAGH